MARKYCRLRDDVLKDYSSTTTANITTSTVDKLLMLGSTVHYPTISMLYNLDSTKPDHSSTLPQKVPYLFVYKSENFVLNIYQKVGDVTYTQKCDLYSGGQKFSNT